MTGRATGRTTRWAAGLVLAVPALLTVVGCGDGDDTDEKPSSHGKTSTSPSAHPSSDEPSAESSESAADGSDVGACADGDCEIAVSEKVTFRFKGPRGQATLSVTEVGPDKVEYTVKSGSGRAKGGASGPGQGCVTVLRSNGSGNSCGGLGDGARPSPQPGAVVIQAATGEDGTAILHIVSR
ncbi:hypothetical protein [Streptomyces flavofungini]|uniref:hypothetical protein n=1 Tax=Streptomyces flavofungini TaxID=68200 RepID=UPI0025B1B023|nr:hypothetical protein [Streptomyces flavofungini]WJV50850.1 hypothetical protein QUY26_38295 [Streptomyces flavofungini]